MHGWATLTDSTMQITFITALDVYKNPKMFQHFSEATYNILSIHENTLKCWMWPWPCSMGRGERWRTQNSDVCSMGKNLQGVNTVTYSKDCLKVIQFLDFFRHPITAPTNQVIFTANKGRQLNQATPEIPISWQKLKGIWIFQEYLKNSTKKSSISKWFWSDSLQWRQKGSRMWVSIFSYLPTKLWLHVHPW